MDRKPSTRRNLNLGRERCAAGKTLHACRLNTPQPTYARKFRDFPKAMSLYGKNCIFFFLIMKIVDLCISWLSSAGCSSMLSFVTSLYFACNQGSPINNQIIKICKLSVLNSEEKNVIMNPESNIWHIFVADIHQGIKRQMHVSPQF